MGAVVTGIPDGAWNDPITGLLEDVLCATRPVTIHPDETSDLICLAYTHGPVTLTLHATRAGDVHFMEATLVHRGGDVVTVDSAGNVRTDTPAGSFPVTEDQHPEEYARALQRFTDAAGTVTAS